MGFYNSQTSRYNSVDPHLGDTSSVQNEKLYFRSTKYRYIYIYVYITVEQTLRCTSKYMYVTFVVKPMSLGWGVLHAKSSTGKQKNQYRKLGRIKIRRRQQILAISVFFLNCMLLILTSTLVLGINYFVIGIGYYSLSNRDARYKIQYLKTSSFRTTKVP